VGKPALYASDERPQWEALVREGVCQSPSLAYLELGALQPFDADSADENRRASEEKGGRKKGCPLIFGPSL